MVDLEAFPELRWLSAYLSSLHILQSEHDHLSCTLESVAASGEVYHHCWIEPYTKTKQGKEYTYHQLRWLTGERKLSGQPKVKTKHLSHRAIGAVQAAIARGHQVEALEKQRRQVEEEMERLRYLMRTTGRRLHRVISQHKGEEGNGDAS
jgi:hypothetical protein